MLGDFSPGWKEDIAVTSHGSGGITIQISFDYSQGRPRGGCNAQQQCGLGLLEGPPDIETTEKAADDYVVDGQLVLGA